MKNRTRIFCAKPLRIRFDKIHGFIRVYDRTRYLGLFDTEKYDSIYDKIIFSISHKSDLHMLFLILCKIKIDSYDCLSLEETFFLHNFITLI